MPSYASHYCLYSLRSHYCSFVSGEQYQQLQSRSIYSNYSCSFISHSASLILSWSCHLEASRVLIIVGDKRSVGCLCVWVKVQIHCLALFLSSHAEHWAAWQIIIGLCQLSPGKLILVYITCLYPSEGQGRHLAPSVSDSSSTTPSVGLPMIWLCILWPFIHHLLITPFLIASLHSLDGGQVAASSRDAKKPWCVSWWRFLDGTSGPIQKYYWYYVLITVYIHTRSVARVQQGGRGKNANK